MPAPQATLDRLHEAFARAEFNEERLSDAGLRDRLRPADEAWPLRTLAREGPLSTLVRLWSIGASIDRAEAATALAPASLDELAAAGLVERGSVGRVRATVSVRPYRGLLIASDRAPGVLSEPRDFVPGVNPIARLLARQTVRLPVDSSLDLGTGNGMQALAAALHSGEVVATDVNPRALAYAELNARLNGIDNVQVAAGSWFEPVAEREFELIVANPPFVISPESDLVYRDSGMSPGELGATLVRGISERLTQGGFGHLTCEWGVQHGEDWTEPPRRWLAETGCDGLVLRHGLVDPIKHATGWNQRLAAAFPDRFENAVERWTRHHREHGFEAIASGTVVLRRRAGKRAPWVSTLALTAGPTSEAGDHVRQLFEGEDLMQDVEATPGQLLAQRLRPAEGLQVEQVLTTCNGRWRQRRAKLRKPGLGLEDHVDPSLLDVVFALDGRRRLEQVVRDVAARRVEDEEALRSLAQAALPGLVRHAFVLPEPDR